MSGIAGVLMLDGQALPESAAAIVRTLTQRQTRRGADQTGYWEDRARGVAMGYSRFRVQDLSPAGAQPMTSRDGHVTVVFNGELYNFAQLRRSQKESGAGFHSISDTEAFCHPGEALTSEKSATEWLRPMDGMFAVAVWDSRHNTLLFARDRIGEKPLSYLRRDIEGRPALMWASEGGSFQALTPAPEPNVEFLEPYLVHGHLPHGIPAWNGVHQLAPGHALLVRVGERSEPKAFLWDATIPYEPLVEGAGDALTDERFLELLTHAVQSRLNADVRVGLFLSSGADSVALACALKALGRDDVQTFTAKFANSPMDESAKARQIADHLGLPHDILTIDVQPNDVIKTLALLDLPSANSNAVPFARLCDAAGEVVRVALSGEGSDEALAGFARYRHLRSASWIARLAHPFRSLLPEPDRTVASPVTRFGTMCSVIRNGGARDWNVIYRGLVGIFPKDARRELSPEVRASVDMAPMRPGVEPESWAQLADTQLMLPNGPLMQADRISYASNVEIRAPFLQPDFFAACFRAPLRQRRQGKSGKMLLRVFLRRHVPEQMLYDRQRGFESPLPQWLAGPLRDWVAEAMTPATSRLIARGWIQPKPVETLWARFTATQDRHLAVRVYALAALEDWMRRQGS